MDATIEHSYSLDHKGRARRFRGDPFLVNLFGEQALFVMSKG